MARINTNQMVQLGTTYGSRVQKVQQDPVVRRAWTEAAINLRQALTSTTSAVAETRDAWVRSGDAVAAPAPAAPLAA
jgi:hypothetical protein